MIMAMITASGNCSGVGNIGVKGAAKAVIASAV